MRFGSDHQGAQQDQGCAEPLEFGVPNLRMAGATHSHRIHGAAIYGDIYHQYTPNVSIYAIHGSYGIGFSIEILSGNHHGDPWSI